MHIKHSIDPATVSRMQRGLGALLIAAVCSFPAGAADRPLFPVNDPSAAGKASGGRSASAHRTLAWEELVPPGWNPMQGFDMKEIANLPDSDPRARAALERLRRAWDDAPARAELNDARVRLPGYVVPLGMEGRKLREFLLVPYFGACVHSPPPPSNQIVHVVMDRPADGIAMMDAVWVSGRMQVASFSSEMGSASYRIEGVEVVLHKR